MPFFLSFVFVEQNRCKKKNNKKNPEQYDTFIYINYKRKIHFIQVWQKFPDLY